jgi:hypothetical protein
VNGLQELFCINCGAALPLSALQGDLVACVHCGTTYRQPASLTPEPQIGDLLLGADFRDPSVPGWAVFNRDKLEFRPGSPAELWVTFPPDDRMNPILRTPGPLDDFDVSVTMRFIDCAYENAHAGLEVRSGDAGDYVVSVSAQGTFRVGWHNGSEWGGELVKWSDHPQLRNELGASHRLRVLMRGAQLRVYLNGTLATSLRDERFPFGHVRLVVAPSKAGPPLTIAFSDLQLREALAK